MELIQLIKCRPFKIVVDIITICCLVWIYDMWLNQWFNTPVEFYKYGKTLPEYVLMGAGFAFILDKFLNSIVYFTKYIIKYLNEHEGRL